MGEITRPISIIISEIKSGTSTREFVKIGEYPTGAPILIPLHVIKGEANGPVLWINGAVHGDETNGVAALLALSNELQPKRINGTVIITPVSNPLAFQARQKNTPQDLLDLDQQFPGVEKGTISERIAFQLYDAIQLHATHVIDVHTVGSYFKGRPYTVFKKLPGELSENAFKQSEQLARVFGGRFHCKLDFSKKLNEIPGNTEGFLDVQSLKRGIPAFMVEIGSGGLIEPDNVSFALQGFKNVLRQLGISDDKTETRDAGTTILNRSYIYSDVGGLLTKTAEAGDFVKQNETIAEITNLLGEVIEIKAPADAYIIINRRNPTVETGDRLFFLGTNWEN
ncbi:hypothetical protein [Streptomyces afghaniensis 772] [Streptomyces afghaniensis]